jgi:hypothetical protein
MERGDEALRALLRPQTLLSSPGLTGRPGIPEAAVKNREAAAYWITRFRGDDN